MTSSQPTPPGLQPSTRHIARRARSLLVPLLLALSTMAPDSGCGGGGFSFGSRNECTEIDYSEIRGLWTITGEGHRSLCTNSEWDGPFDLRISRPWIVTTDGQQVRVDPRVYSNSFEIVSATTQCDSVTIEAYERVELPDGSRTRLDWEFEVTFDGSRELRGKLRGSGPAECRVRGDLRVRVEGP